MSIEEIIKRLEYTASLFDNMRKHQPKTDEPGTADILRAAIALLKTNPAAQPSETEEPYGCGVPLAGDAQPNEPLTLEAMEDALDQMNGGLHVWVDDFKAPGYPVAGIIDFGTEIVAVTGYKGPYFRGRDYGKTWLAYLRQPTAQPSATEEPYGCGGEWAPVGPELRADRADRRDPLAGKGAG